jgi:hypothetical protein
VKTVERAKSLEERVTTRLHESIGDLITDADLKVIVERGIELALFHPRELTGAGYHTTRKAALVDDLVEKLLAAKMAVAVDTWLRDNPDKLKEALDRAITNGVGQAVMRAMDMRFEGIFSSGVAMLESQGYLRQSP